MTHLILVVLAIVTMISCFLKLSKYIQEKIFTAKDFFHIALSGVPMILILLFQMGFDHPIYSYIKNHIFLTLGFLSALIGLAMSLEILILKFLEESKISRGNMITVGSTVALSLILILIGVYQS